MFTIDFSSKTKKDFKKIDKTSIQFIYDSLREFRKSFSSEYESALLKTGKIKKLKGYKKPIYRLKLRSYRIVYEKHEDKLVILVLHITSRESAYK